MGVDMVKRYMIWWHSFVDNIDRDAATLEEVYDSVSKTLEEINKLKLLEQEGKIKVKEIGALNPLFIDIIDKSVEQDVINNPIVDVDEVE